MRKVGAFLLGLLFLPLRAEAAVVLSEGRLSMGTVLEVTLEAQSREEGRRVAEGLFGLSRRLEGLFSSFDPQSALSRLNRRSGLGPQRVGGELGEILALSLGYFRLTGGAFDITVGPLVELWRQAERRGVLPSEEELRKALARVGSGKIRLGPRGWVELEASGMALDLGGIGKGYALDRMVEELRREGVRRAFLSFGQSSLFALGSSPEGGRWQVLLRGPEGGFVGKVTLRDEALSVSAALGQVREIGGRPYGHVVDPRTGWALERRLEAFVVAPRASQAEALSTALLVLGEREGLGLIEGLPWAEGMLYEAGGRVWTTEGWVKRTAFVFW